MQHWRFDNRFIQELPGDPLTDNLRSRQVPKACWSAVPATPVAAPKLVAWSVEMAQLLDLEPEHIAHPEFAQVFAGNRLWPGMKSYATRYGGHQFGHWAGQLGDGRALHLGELLTKTGQRWDLQLKGAGPTPYSRNADGRAVLRSSLREFLCSEAMYHLGVPTTRALCLVTTGEDVIRDILYQGDPQPEPGAIVCRVAPSFIRFGHFEILAANREAELLKQLVDFTIARDFPEITGSDKVIQWFNEVCKRTAVMLAHWMRVGFVHGVMNTDNMSILGLTIDYGPYGWIDNYDPDWTPNTTDAYQGRYRFGQQPAIAQWNLACLAAALQELFDSPEPLKAGLNTYLETFMQTNQTFSAQKFGFEQMEPVQEALVSKAFGLMQKAEVDMTLFFRRLASVDLSQPNPASLQDAFYQEKDFIRDQTAWQQWLNDYAAQMPTDPIVQQQRRDQMNQVNPCYVLRNYLAQEAIELAENGDYSRIELLQQALRHPYAEMPEYEFLAQKRPDWARDKPGCSMLSCSS